MPLEKCQLDNISDLSEVLNIVQQQLALAETASQSINGLVEALIQTRKSPIEITWNCAEASVAVMGDDFGKIAAALKQVELERSDFRIRFR